MQIIITAAHKIHISTYRSIDDSTKRGSLFEKHKKKQSIFSVVFKLNRFQQHQKQINVNK